MHKSKLKNKLIFQKFRVGKIIYDSILSSIHEGINVINKEQVAMKFEKIEGKYHFLESEVYFLYLLKGKGIPKVISYGKSGKYKVLIEELLGKSIYFIWNSYDKRKKLNDLCLISLQCLDRLEFIHSKDIIHKDIKPFNFLIGKKDPELIYLIDFGISKKYRSSKTGKHINFGQLRCTEGSLRYMSLNGNNGYETSRRDDLESLGYILVFLLKQTLPWLGVEKLKISKFEKNKKIAKIKSMISPEELCQGLPKEFSEYIKYTRNLNFEQDPNYAYLRKLFLDIILKNEQLPDYKFIDFQKFSWIKKKEIKSKNNIPFSNNGYSLPKKSFNNTLKKRKIGARTRLYKQIKDSCNRAKSQDIHKINNNNFFKFDLNNINIILNNIDKPSNDEKNKIKNDEKNKNISKTIEVNDKIPFNKATLKKNEKKPSQINKEKPPHHSIHIKPSNHLKNVKSNENNSDKIKNNNTHKNFNNIKDKFNLIHFNNSSLLPNFNTTLDINRNSYKNKYYKTLEEREKEKFKIYIPIINDKNETLFI